MESPSLGERGSRHLIKSDLRFAMAVLNGVITRQDRDDTNEETEHVRASIRMIRSDFKLAEEPGASLDDYESFKARLEALPYGGLQAVQTVPNV